MSRTEESLIDIMEVLEQLGIDKEKYTTWSSNESNKLLPFTSENVRPLQKQ
jgi:hypothetical protein